MPLLDWHARTSSLTPAGIVASGMTARALLTLLLQRSAEQLQPLSLVATRDLLVILGPNDALPWVDGVRYCAPDAGAPELWLPTHIVPHLPLDLVQSALLCRADSRPVLLWNAPEQILPLSNAAAVDSALLSWLIGEWA